MRRIGFSVFALAWLVYVSSFFLTALVAVEGDFLGWRGVWKVDLQGWLVTLLAFGSLGDIHQAPLLAVVTFVATLSNLVMLWSPWAIFSRSGQGVRALSWVAPFATMFNMAVYAIWQSEAQLGSGYFAWVTSFALLTVALFMLRSGLIRYRSATNGARAA